MAFITVYLDLKALRLTKQLSQSKASQMNRFKSTYGKLIKRLTKLKHK